MIPQKKILVVEDNELNRAILCEILAENYQVLEAENGREALDILRQQGDSIALILLDVMMPVMDGFTFLDRVKEDSQLELVPVIVMTQSDSEADEVAALAHGATDFVPKPYRPQVILHRIASIIKLRETAAMVNMLQYDRLTGVYTKEFFYRKMRERLDENPDKSYTIVCSDIENFKLYNDTFGREAGDRLLQTVAANTRAKIGEGGICGRYGADCFLFLQESEKEKADRICFFGEDYSDRPERLNQVSVKWGIYEITDRSIPVEQMCDRALLAVNSVKGQYNRHFAVCDDTFREKMLREAAITDAMERALAEKQFIVYYQPKYNLNDECMAGAEALVRWVHPEWGFLSPGEFIPLFEKNGFILQLDQYIWEQVCAQLRDWNEAGYPSLPVSVNVSRADVYQLDLVEIFTELTQKYGVDPVNLHLEITESAYAENPGPIINTVNELRKHGFTIEMDDFGSGYSSLNMLNQMKMDILKLDMKFIQSEMEKPTEQSILNYVIRMSHGIGLSVVAEGVETREQLERLKDLGCDYVQGYYFAKPMPASEFTELLKTQKVSRGFSAVEISPEEDFTYSLMVIDEDAAFRESVRKSFAEHYHVLEESDVSCAIERLRTQERVGISGVILSMTLPEDGASVLINFLRQDPAFWHIPVLATLPNGGMMDQLPLAREADDFLCKCHPMFDLHRRVELLMNLAAARGRESALQDAASRDYLTGLLNRRGLRAAMDSLRKEDMPLAVCLFDIDDLKKINDTCGHDAGDRMLCSFADLLRSQTREGDILCRYGGDEFVVILKRLYEVEDARKRGSDICQAFHSYSLEEQLPASCSVGISLCRAEDKPSVRLIEQADQVLYRAKRENKGGCCVWMEESR